jgi:hypothetical protein
MTCYVAFQSNYNLQRSQKNKYLYLFSKVKQGDENARYVMGNYKVKEREWYKRWERKWRWGKERNRKERRRKGIEILA